MKKETQPNPDRLKKRLEIKLPLIGFYDAPDPALFKPLIRPKERDCVFCFFKNWVKSETLHLTKDRYGCGGAGHSLWGIQTRPRKDFRDSTIIDKVNGSVDFQLS